MLNCLCFFTCQLDCCAINKVTSGTNDFDESPWCKDTGKSCKDTLAEVPRTCCVDVDASTYTAATTACTTGVSGYNTLVSLSLFYESLNKK